MFDCFISYNQNATCMYLIINVINNEYNHCEGCCFSINSYDSQYFYYQDNYRRLVNNVVPMYLIRLSFRKHCPVKISYRDVRNK